MLKEFVELKHGWITIQRLIPSLIPEPLYGEEASVNFFLLKSKSSV